MLVCLRPFLSLPLFYTWKPGKTPHCLGAIHHHHSFMCEDEFGGDNVGHARSHTLQVLKKKRKKVLSRNYHTGILGSCFKSYNVRGSQCWFTIGQLSWSIQFCFNFAKFYFNLLSEGNNHQICSVGKNWIFNQNKLHFDLIHYNWNESRFLYPQN